MAQDPLAMMLSHIIGQAGAIPRPSLRRGRKFRQIQSPPIESAKLDLYHAFRESGLRKAELARRMGIRKTNIDRLFDPEHPSASSRLKRPSAPSESVLSSPSKRPPQSPPPIPYDGIQGPHLPENGHDRLDRIEIGLERLKERHEALTRTVEIIAGMQSKNEVLMAQALEAINSLARIAASHERRLDHLETGG